MLFWELFDRVYMRIVVVNYDEINEKPSGDKVVGDVVCLFEQASTIEKENMGRVLRQQIEDMIGGDLPEIFFMDTTLIKRDHLSEELKKMEIDLLVTYNLAGFELSTLAGSLSYNLVDCRQFHFIKTKECPNKEFLNKIKSINMFFDGMELVDMI